MPAAPIQPEFQTMWEQYRKTAKGMQIIIAVVTIAVVIWSHHLAAGAMFFVVMQLSAVLGAGWSVRLRRLQERGRLMRLGRG
ncbi:MAG TPA: hypothetical protein VER12_10280 [Polyangiaceae bacterium]|nr:hypothetical protein [Polyangiaceae bacterium]